MRGLQKHAIHNRKISHLKQNKIPIKSETSTVYDQMPWENGWSNEVQKCNRKVETQRR